MALPVTSSSSMAAITNAINDINRDMTNLSQTQVFYGPNNVQAVVNGKLPGGIGYGLQFSDSAGIPRILAYINSTNTPVFKISQAGVDVTTATNAQLTFNSAQNVFKIVATGTFSIPSVSSPAPAASTFKRASSTGVTYTHGLGYVPAFLGYEVTSTAYFPVPYTQIFSPSGNAGGWSQVQLAVDGTTLTGGCDVMSGNTPTAGVTITYTGGVVRWYLMQEVAS